MTSIVTWTAFAILAMFYSISMLSCTSLELGAMDDLLVVSSLLLLLPLTELPTWLPLPHLLLSPPSTSLRLPS